MSNTSLVDKVGWPTPIRGKTWPVSSRRCVGYTMVELMVGLALMAVILMAGVPLTSGWVDDARINESVSQMEAGYAQARAIAIRNSEGSVDTVAPAAVLCVSNGAIYVHAGLPSACGEDALWQANVAGGSNTTIKTADASAAFVCVGVGNRGYPIDAVLAGTSCTTETQVTVNRGGKSVQKNLF